MSELRRTSLHRALLRENLLLGGERELVLFSGIISVAIAVSGLNLVAIITGAVLWFGCIAGLRAMAKVDPYLSKIYQRQLIYSFYYNARSTPFYINLK